MNYNRYYFHAYTLSYYRTVKTKNRFKNRAPIHRGPPVFVGGNDTSTEKRSFIIADNVIKTNTSRRSDLKRWHKYNILIADRFPTIIIGIAIANVGLARRQKVLRGVNSNQALEFTTLTITINNIYNFFVMLKLLN